MKLAELLIDKATKACGGNQAELARRMGIYPADVTNLKTGKRPLSPEIAAELADIAGEDARQAAIDAVIERSQGTRKGQVLREILGKGLHAGAWATLLCSYSSGFPWNTVSPTTASTLIDALRIVSNLPRLRPSLRP